MEIGIHNNIKRTPYERKIQWIEMDKSYPWIKTGLYTDDGLWHVEADVFVVYSGENSMIYAIQDNSNGMMFGPVYFHNDYIRLGYGSTNGIFSVKCLQAINNWNHFDVVLSPGNQNLILNGEFIKSGTQPYDYSRSSVHITIGRRNYGISFSAGVGTKFGNIRIWHNNKLVRDFNPVLTKSGVGAMFDNVSWKLFEDENGNGFIPGPDIRK